MKKLFLSLLFPITLFAANTNVFDNVKVNTSLTDNGTFIVTGYIRSPERYLLDSHGFPVVDWNNTYLNDTNNTPSLLWTDRIGQDENGAQTFRWDTSRQFNGGWTFTPATINSAATITPNFSSANVFNCTITNNATLAVPINGQQDGTVKIWFTCNSGTNTVTLASGYKISPSMASLPTNSFSVIVGTETVILAEKRGSLWNVTGFIPNFSTTP